MFNTTLYAALVSRFLITNMQTAAGFAAGVMPVDYGEPIPPEDLALLVQFLVATAGPDVVRFLPPLIVEQDRIDEVVDVFDEILRQGLD